MFGPKYNGGKLKVNLKLAINRVKMLQKKKENQSLLSRKEVAQLLEKSKIELAKIRTEQIIRDDFMIETLEIMEIYFNTLVTRMGMIEQVKSCDPGIREAVCTVIWVTPYLQAEVTEIKAITMLLGARYGKDFVKEAQENTGKYVSERVIKKMSVTQPGGQLVEAYLHEIANSYGIKYTTIEPLPEELMRGGFDPSMFPDAPSGDGMPPSGGGGGGMMIPGQPNVYNPGWGAPPQQPQPGVFPGVPPGGNNGGYGVMPPPVVPHIPPQGPPQGPPQSNPGMFPPSAGGNPNLYPPEKPTDSAALYPPEKPSAGAPPPELYPPQQPGAGAGGGSPPLSGNDGGGDSGGLPGYTPAVDVKPPAPTAPGAPPSPLDLNKAPQDNGSAASHDGHAADVDSFDPFPMPPSSTGAMPEVPPAVPGQSSLPPGAESAPGASSVPDFDDLLKRFNDLKSNDE